MKDSSKGQDSGDLTDADRLHQHYLNLFSLNTAESNGMALKYVTKTKDAAHCWVGKVREAL